MEAFNNIAEIVTFVANVLSIVASSIAIFVFIYKGSEIRAAFSLLLNWSFQLTLTELKSKLERLNEYNASEPTEVEEIRNILHEIAGQIRGNRRLQAASPLIATRLEELANSKKLTEPRKRAMTSELRETLRSIEVNTFTTNSGVENV
jgi:hypothetical protein